MKATGGAAAIRKMAAGKKRVDNFQWQIQVTNNEEWEDLLQRKGLIVIDVYQEWCGPCTAMAGHLKEIKLQLGDDLLHCALAKADAIDQLEKFRGRSEPTWLFLAGGEPVDFIKGANAPLIRQTIINELEQEKRVMASLHQRDTISWDSIEFPVDEPVVEEEEDDEAADADAVIPPDWRNMDAILLKGLYHDIVDDVQQRLADISVDVVHTSEVILADEEVSSLILWLTSDPNRDEHFIESIDNIIIEAIDNPLNKNESANVDEEEEKPKEENEEKEEEEQKEERIEEEEPEEEKPSVTIEYRLLFDAEKVEELVRQCQPADPVEAVPDDVVELADNEQHEEVEESIENQIETTEEKTSSS